MCGIIGVVGSSKAIDVVLDGLRDLEPRGYDAAGIGLVLKPEGERVGGFQVVKEVGSTEVLRRHVGELSLPTTSNAIGHTRWATHGSETRENAHPHVSSSGKVMVVHNGTIHNHQALRLDLIERGFHFASETDTEVIANLIERFYLDPTEHQDGLSKPMRALTTALNLLEGKWGLVVCFADLPDEHLFVSAHGESLVVGVGDGCMYAASEALPLYRYTNRFYILHEGECARVSVDGLHECVTVSSRVWHREPTEMRPRSIKTSSRNPGESSMRQEIYDTPNCILNFLTSFGDQVIHDPLRSLLRDMQLPDTRGQRARLFLTGCGSAYNACLYGQHILGREVGVEVYPVLASDSTLHLYDVGQNDLIIAVSQSGTTFDTVSQVEQMRRRRVPILAILNDQYVALDRIASAAIYLDAGKEDGVAATKTFTTQCLAFAAMMAVINGPGCVSTSSVMSDKSLYTLADNIRTVLQLEEQIRVDIAPLIERSERIFLLGQRELNSIAQEGALKLQEVAQVDVYGRASTELKHGLLALLTERTVTIALIPDDEALCKASILCLEEIRSRKHGPIIAVVSQKSALSVRGVADIALVVPTTTRWMMPLLQVVPLQLLAFHVALRKNLNPDRPRNLAKAIVV